MTVINIVIIVIVTWALQTILAFEALQDCQLALNGAHDLPHPVQGVLNPLEGPQEAKQTQVGRHGLSIDDGRQGLLHVIP